MSEKKTKKRLNNERSNSDKKSKESPSFLAEPNSKRQKLDPKNLITTSPIKNTPSFGEKSSERSHTTLKDDQLLGVLTSEEELNGQRRKKYEGKFEELSDQFRQRGITKEMRACIDSFSKDSRNYRRIDLTDKAKQKRVAVLNRE